MPQFAVPVRSAFDVSLQTIFADSNQLVLVATDHETAAGYLHGLVHRAFHANGNSAWVTSCGSPRTSGAGVSRGR